MQNKTNKAVEHFEGTTVHKAGGVKPEGAHRTNVLDAVTLKRSKMEPGLHGDGGGLYLKVEKNGSKRWILRIVTNGKRRDMGLGGYPLVPLADARAKALEYRRIARDGQDAFTVHKKKKASAMTFAVAAAKVHEEVGPTLKNAKTQVQWLKQIETYAFPLLGHMPVAVITQADVLKVLTPIWNEKGHTAKKLKYRLAKIFDWSKGHGHRTGDNPVQGIKIVLPRQIQKEVHHKALPYAQIAEFMQRLKAAPRASTSGKLSLEWLILSASRCGEVRFATWSEIDMTAKTWTLPVERMKASKTAHVVPLTERHLEILDEMRAAFPDAKPTDWLFPADNGKPWSENAFTNTTQARGFGDIVAHGFRSTFRDWSSEETAFEGEVAEMALAHVVANKVEAAYRRDTLLPKRRILMQQWADYCSGKEVEADNVVRPQFAATVR
jgi:integrase